MKSSFRACFFVLACVVLAGAAQAEKADREKPMNIEADLPDVGALALRDKPAVRADVARIEAMWSELLTQYGGPYLFGSQFTIADAYFAPVCSRIKTYGLPVPASIRQYIDETLELPAMQAWTAAARAEHQFLADDEPYRTSV